MKKQGFVMLLLMTVSQVLQFGSMVLLARWYSPAEIGELSQLTALLLFFAPWGALCMPYAFALSQSLVEKNNLLQLCRLLAVVFALAFVSVLSFLPVIDGLATSPLYVLLLGIALYASAMQAVYQQWFYSFQQFSLPAYLVLITTVFLVGGRVIVGVADRDYRELLYLTMVVPILALFLSRYYFRKNLILPRPNFRQFQYLLSKYHQFPLYQAPQQVLNAVSQQAPILLFALWYNDDMTGHYALALACLGAPVAILSRALGDWLYPQLASCTATKFSGLLINSTLILVIAGLLPMVALMSAHQTIFTWVFGAQWSQAGHIASILAPWFFLIAVNTPALKAIMIMQAQKYTLMLNAVTMVLRIGGISGVYLSGADSMFAIWWLSVCGVAHNALVIGGALLLDRKRNAGKAQVTS